MAISRAKAQTKQRAIAKRLGGAEQKAARRRCALRKSLKTSEINDVAPLSSGDKINIQLLGAQSRHLIRLGSLRRSGGERRPGTPLE